MTLILSNAEIETLVSMPECIDTLEEAYVELAEGRGVTRRRSDTLVAAPRHDGLYGLKTMDGVAEKAGVSAVRINSDIVTWPEVDGKRRRVKVPAAPNGRYVGLVLLFSTDTGEPLAIFPDAVVQRLRVGATNGLAVKYLARPDAAAVGLIGSGWQAGAQLMAVAAVRKLSTVRCFSPNRDNREAFARNLSPVIGVEIEPVGAPEDAVAGADIALCATSSIEPVFQPEWVLPGMHVSSIKRPELPPQVIKGADRMFIFNRDTSPTHATPPGLEIPEKKAGKGWSLLGEVDFDALPLLPDLIAGREQGRRSPEEVTCFINNMGMGYQFAVVGALVYSKAREAHVGRDLDTDWFTEAQHP